MSPKKNAFRGTTSLSGCWHPWPAGTQGTIVKQRSASAGVGGRGGNAVVVVVVIVIVVAVVSRTMLLRRR